MLFNTRNYFSEGRRNGHDNLPEDGKSLSFIHKHWMIVTETQQTSSDRSQRCSTSKQLKFLPAEPPLMMFQVTSRHRVALLSFCLSVNTDGKEGKSPTVPFPQIILSTLAGCNS